MCPSRRAGMLGCLLAQRPVLSHPIWSPPTAELSSLMHGRGATGPLPGGNKPRRRKRFTLECTLPWSSPFWFLSPFGDLFTDVTTQKFRLLFLVIRNHNKALGSLDKASLHFLSWPEPAPDARHLSPCLCCGSLPDILGIESTNLYLYLEQAFNSKTTGAERSQINLWFNSPLSELQSHLSTVTGGCSSSYHTLPISQAFQPWLRLELFSIPY